MGSLIEIEEEESRFFDAFEDIALIPDTIQVMDSDITPVNPIVSNSAYDVWIGGLESVEDRRSKFLNWIRADSNTNAIAAKEKNDDDNVNVNPVDRVRVRDDGAVLRNKGSEREFWSNRSSLTCLSDDNVELYKESSFVCREPTVDGGMSSHGCLEVSSELSSMAMDSETSSSTSTSSNQIPEKENEEMSKLVEMAKRIKDRWLSRMRRKKQQQAMNKQREAEADRLRSNINESSLLWNKIQNVKVKQRKKQSKELSALFNGQDIQAHKGSILSMKFSPDGQYLASAGKDGVVRVWQVVEDDRSNKHDVPDIHPSCMYFEMYNNTSELKPLNNGNHKMAEKSSDSACVVLPQKCFRILEKPLHELHGHTGDIFDLSWSTNNHLLSSSADKTVRLWRVGSDHCLKVFFHSNFVTSVEFNPVDDNSFISGSIDGKVRIWAISCCQVVDWTDVRDIVTAVCYLPNGQGVVVGSLTSNCRFYSISGNHLQLDAQICLHSKKKPSACKRITGFQFCPQEPSKLMVTCADSTVRILHGLNVIGKYKGCGNTGSASFTSDGKHIVSTSDDSNVYLWNRTDHHEGSAPKKVKNVKSYERFSNDASIAIPWPGMTKDVVSSENRSPLPVCFSLRQEHFADPFPKGSATWPEEQLPPSPLFPSAMNKSQYKFLKASCQNTSRSHAWGLVIVTAGWDGRIRSFHNYGLPVLV